MNKRDKIFLEKLKFVENYQRYLSKILRIFDWLMIMDYWLLGLSPEYNIRGLAFEGFYVKMWLFLLDFERFLSKIVTFNPKFI